MVAALRYAVGQVVIDEWKPLWKDSERRRQLFKVVPEPGMLVLAPHRGTPRAISWLIVQMETGKIGLRNIFHLKWVLGVTSGECDYRRGLQTVSHMLYLCSQFSELRLTLRTLDEKGRRS